MDNEFDKQASKILRENVDDISAERWSDEWDTTEFTPQINQAIKEFEVGLVNLEDASVFDLKDIVDEIVADDVLDGDIKTQAIDYLKHLAKDAMASGRLEDFELYGSPSYGKGIFSDVPEWDV